MQRAPISNSAAKQTIALGLKAWATFSNRAIDGILGYAQKHEGYEFRDMPWSKAEQLPELLRRARPAGAIVSLTSIEYAAIRKQLPADLPLVSIGADTLDKGVGIVCSDDHAMMTLAMNHLRGVGYQRMGFVGWEGSAGSARRAALLRRLRRNVAIVNVQLRAPHEDLDAATMEELEAWLVSQRRPVGVIAWNGTIAGHVRSACIHTGLRMPQDVGILSLSDERTCLVDEPTISAVDVNGEKLGLRAMTMLAAMMQGSRRPRRRIAIRPTAVIERQSTTIARYTSDPVDAALRYIEQNALRGIAVKNVLAALPGVARTQFYANFTQRIGYAPADYIRRLKIERAKQLLVGTELSLTRVADMCGFASTNQFGDTFKREAGATPLDFRHQGC